jgi:hypothetical protein
MQTSHAAAHEANVLLHAALWQPCSELKLGTTTSASTDDTGHTNGGAAASVIALKLVLLGALEQSGRTRLQVITLICTLQSQCLQYS